FSYAALDPDVWTLERQLITPHDGTAHLYFQQFYEGLEVFQSELRFHIDRDGRILSVNGGLPLRSPASRVPRWTAAQAVPQAALGVLPEAPSAFTPEALGAPEGPAQRTRFAPGPFADVITARLVFFPMAESARLAWEVLLTDGVHGDCYEILIDAEDG